MMAKLPYWPRAVIVVGCLLGLGLTGCVLPVPTIPLNLPAHGHTYKVRDRNNLPPAGEGILIIRTYYPPGFDAMERLDGYPIRNGRAAVPFTLDVRSRLTEMFGYFSWCFPTFYLTFANADHAHVYAVMPGLMYLGELSHPYRCYDRSIDGLKPRPDVLSVFPSNPHLEKATLQGIEREMQIYFIQADNNRKDGCGPSREELHNEAQARLIVQYVHARLQVLANARPAATTHPGRR